ncbi:MAG: hypothetical protein M1832_003750 [Thelocarpon impressellum]|nr:MAG: hypothetical protein M1832_003750 [Thelocarpon impressellum]
MATADPDLKRARYGSWSGPSGPAYPPPPPPSQGPQRVQHPSEASARFAAGQPLPTSAQTTYHESEQRELPDPLSHPYHGHDPSSHPYSNSQGHSTYVTPANGVGGHYPPDQQAYPRHGGTPMKSRSPIDSQPPPPPPQQQQQPMRPLSVSTGNTSQQPMQYPIDHPPPGPYDSQSNGVHHGLPMPSHDAMPSAHPASYGTSPVSAGPRDSFYMASSSLGGPVVTTFPPRRKAIRAAQRKAKCDEGRPSCGFCKEAAMPCVYREVPPPKQDRTLLQILQKIERIEARLDEVRGARWPTDRPHPDDQIPQDDSDEAEHDEPERSARVVQPGPIAPELGQSLVSGTLQGTVEDVQVKPEDQAVSDEIGDLSIPMEHTTAAHKLLRWPSIHSLMAQLTEDELYVMQGEEKRGILRLHGRGEGIEINNFGAPATAGDHGGSGSDQAGLDDVWGTGLPSNGGARRAAGECIGGLNADGTLKLDTPTLLRLLDSYLANMHIMHPFLNKEQIKQTVYEFGGKYGPAAEHPPRSPYGMPGSPYSAMGMRRDSPTLNKTTKRKRSSTNMTGTPPSMSNPSAPRPLPQRDVSTALVLLVIALGKICEHKEFLPGPAPVVQAPLASSVVSPPNYEPHSVKHSPVSSHSSSFTSVPSPHDAGAPASRPYIDQSHGMGLTNADVTPGLAYYAMATNILGELIGANELYYVQACLLAGLTKFNEETNLVRRDLILTSFWTSLQLESDILAELDLPPSGITRMEDAMPFPKFRSDDTIIGLYYLAQIGLRKLLNRVHNSLYKPERGYTALIRPTCHSQAISTERDTRQASWSTSELSELVNQLTSWRNLLPQDLRWVDGDPPPSEINPARLRAKYYGARYVIHRPFLHHTLHPIPSPQERSQGSPSIAVFPKSQSPTVPGNDRRGSAPMAPPANPNHHRPQLGIVDAGVIDACQNCIGAAMRSTEAFHGIPENHRPIVTNIFGTAHAQFGNLLVLSVASKSDILRDLVPQKDFERLLDRTIRFLDNLSPISPTLAADKRILQRSLKDPSSSFSSTNDGRY